MKLKKIIPVLLTALLLTGASACSKNKEKDYEPKSYAEMNLLHETSDGRELNDYRDQYIESPFYCDVQDSVTYTANAMYDVFLLANKWYPDGNSSGMQVVHRFGGTTPKYFEWMAQKSYWTDDTALKNYVKRTLVNYPIMQRGQLWTWHNSPRWPVSANAQNGSYHYDDHFRFISAVKQIMVWEQSTNLLNEVDDNLYTNPNDDQGNPIPPADADVSVNKTVRQKMDMVLNFIMENLNGKNGLIILPGENTGKRNSKSSNYFDSYAYGNKSAYENQLFYHALLDLCDIEEIVRVKCLADGDAAGASAAAEKIGKYKTLAGTVKTNFKDTFYDSVKGRYIATIDTDGVKWDFGMVIQNLEAVCYGITDAAEQKAIADWINGTRLIKDDTSTGADIYEHKISPRSNTLKIETSQIREDGQWKYWWHGLPEINPATNQKWNESQVNGGILFWSSFYDLMMRFKHFGAENAMKRFKVIADEYEVDLLMRDPSNSTGNKWKLGVIDEFPESGLVPLAYLNGLLGIDAGTDGLHIAPDLPKAYAHAGVKTLIFGGNKYSVKAYRNGGLELSGDVMPLKIYYTPQNGRNFTLKCYDAGGSVIKTEVLELKEGRIILECGKMENCVKIELAAS